MMSRRTRPQKKSDDVAFPVRIRFAIPPEGLACLTDVHSWLTREIGSSQYAVHSSSGIGMDAIGIYLRDLTSAQALIAAFGDLQLADAVESRAYYSPAHDGAWSAWEMVGVCNCMVV